MATSKSIKVKSGTTTVKEVFGYTSDVVTPLETRVSALETTSEDNEEKLFEVVAKNDTLENIVYTGEASYGFTEIDMTVEGTVDEIARPDNTLVTGKYMCRFADYSGSHSLIMVVDMEANPPTGYDPVETLYAQLVGRPVDSRMAFDNDGTGPYFEITKNYPVWASLSLQD